MADLDATVEEPKAEPANLTPEEEAIGAGRTGEMAPIQDRLTLARQLGHSWDNLADFVATKTAAGRAAGFENALIHSFLGYRHAAPTMAGMKQGLSDLITGGSSGRSGNQSK